MESTKGVIRILKNAEYLHGYDIHYYFAGLDVDKNGNITAKCTNNIWDAIRFRCDMLSENDKNRINSLIEFIRNCYLPKQDYLIELIEIKLVY